MDFVKNLQLHTHKTKSKAVSHYSIIEYVFVYGSYKQLILAVADNGFIQ